MFLTVLLTLFGVASSGLVMWKVKNRCKSRSGELPDKTQTPVDDYSRLQIKLIGKIEKIEDEKLIKEIDKELLDPNSKDTNVFLPILEDSEDDELNYQNDSKNDLHLFSV